MQTTSDTPIDFTKVEILRKHMKLTAAEIARLFDVSRMTYYRWLRGKPIRPDNYQRVRDKLRFLLTALKEGWSKAEVIAKDEESRKSELLEALDELV